MVMDSFFRPRSVAVIGASRNPNKVGHVILKNILDGGFEGKVFPINKEASELLGIKSYSSVLKVKERIDLAIIAVPAEFVLKVINECNKSNIKNVLIITAGFREVGNKELEDNLKKLLDKYNMDAIGVNCLGIFDAYNKFDTLFLPRYRLERPLPGGISFVCQSGAVGSAILDLAADKGHKFSKFISYGNATQIDESDLIDYLGKDKNTKVICLYVEGVKDGEKFFKTIEEVGKKKPIVVLKGGLTEKGMNATLSHTGSLAGSKEVYFGIFNQTNTIRVDSLEEMFNVAGLFEKGVSFKNKNIQVITNGGGYGILSTDNISLAKNLEMAEMEDFTAKSLKKKSPKHMNIGNPLDLLGDATTERYRFALEECVKDKNIGAILLIALYQTPLLTTDLIEVISEAKRNSKKPIVVVSTGGEFTEMLSDKLSEMGLPVFGFPNDAVSAMDKVVGWELRRKQ